MFNFLKKKEGGIKVTDRIWMNEKAKMNSFVGEWKKNNEIIYIFWFDDTLRRVESLFQNENIQPGMLFPARQAHAMQLAGKKIVFAEHHPLEEKEIALFQDLKLEQVLVWSALDEPLFKHFGGDKIIQMMKQLGMNEEAAIEHNMISKAIGNAQKKIAAKVSLEQSAHSQADWIEKNLG